MMLIALTKFAKLRSAFTIGVAIVCFSGCGFFGSVLDEYVICQPDEPNPGCIDDSELSALSPLSGHVLILTGIAGRLLSLDNNADESITSISTTISNQPSLPWSAQQWDWTDTEEIDDLRESFLDLGFAARLQENRKTRQVAARLARRIRAWQDRNPDRRLSLLCGSGGALIAVLAAESTDVFGNKILRDDFHFERVVFVSASLPTSRSIEALAQRTREGGIYNYYAMHDGILNGWLCGAFGASELISIGWRAAGRYGYRPDEANSAFVVMQLAWTDLTRSIQNDGRHMLAYKSDFFDMYLRSVVKGEDIPDGWMATNVPIEYEDALKEPILDLGADFTGPALAATANAEHVVILPSHEGQRGESSLVRQIEQDLDVSAEIWDWTQLDGVARKGSVDLLRDTSLSEASAQFARAISIWRKDHPGTRLHVIAASGGTLIAILACGATDTGGAKVLSQGDLATLVLLSGAHSTSRSLADAKRIAVRVYCYYSSENRDLLGERFECPPPNETASFRERLSEAVGARVVNPIPWPPVGFFGYRESDGEAVYITAQRGWIESDKQLGNFGRFPGEYNRKFFAREIIPLLRDGVDLPERWMVSVDPSYEPIDRESLDVPDRPSRGELLADLLANARP